MQDKLKKEIDDYFSDRTNLYDLRKKFLQIIKSKDELDFTKLELNKIKKNLEINKKTFDNTVFAILLSGRISKISKIIEMSNLIEDHELNKNKKKFFIKR